jgi:myo-inositol catabolism protein IolC
MLRPRAYNADMSVGYNHQLFLLPFDHRASFVHGLLHEDGTPTNEEIETVKKLKRLIYQGFLRAVTLGVPKTDAGILVDETFGAEILLEAREAGFATCLPIEKSGQDEFELEYAQDFAEHITAFEPTFVKALIRYNPEGDAALNERQAVRLKSVTEFCHSHGYKFLLEVLVPARPEQLEAVHGDKAEYDKKIRPQLTVRLIQELQAAGVDPDVWKLEGFDAETDYRSITQQIKSGDRNGVGLIILGRDADEAQVDQWLAAGRPVPGVTGFAVGRTIFREPLEQFLTGERSADQVSDVVAERFLHYYRVFSATD